MTVAHPLASFEGHLRTTMGGCFPGERAVMRGLDIHAALRDADWMDMYLFAITGRRHTPAQLRVLHAIWTNTSYPDARLWNNRVAALAGSTRSTGILGISAALAVSEASIFGGQVELAVADFLVRARQAMESGSDLADIVTEELRVNRGIGGYGRPVGRSRPDERNDVVVGIARQEGLANGIYLKLAYAVEGILLSGRWRMRMNYAAIATALSLDLGLSPREYYLYMLPAFLAGMPPCYIEAAERPQQATFPLRCTSLSYEGAPRRSWAESASGHG